MLVSCGFEQVCKPVLVDVCFERPYGLLGIRYIGNMAFDIIQG